MTDAQVLAFSRAAATTSLPRAALDQLHALLTLDPVGGVSPARTLFVASESGRSRLSRHVCPSIRGLILAAPACGLVGYDFAFALQVLQASSAPIGLPEALGLVSRSAALQGESLVRAAQALGLEATPLAPFDASGLKAEFFGRTAETVTFLCRLASTDEADRQARDVTTFQRPTRSP